jgi:hypothetical protein
MPKFSRTPLYKPLPLSCFPPCTFSMAPITEILSQVTARNSTSTSNTSLEFSNPPFGAAVQVILFFISVCVVPTLTAHIPIPVSREDSFGQLLTMILSPVSASVHAFNSIILFVVKVGRGSWVAVPHGSHASHHDIISAGAFAIRIPNRFDKAIKESPFEWKRLIGNIPRTEVEGPRIGNLDPGTVDDPTTLYSLPPTSRLVQSNSYKVFSSSNSIKTAFAILQLGYSVAQAYLQYEPIIRGHGISSPFVIAIAYLYSSFINLFANLVQGSYTHVTIIPPIHHTTASASSSTVQTRIEGHATTGVPSQSQPEESNNFDEWLQIHFPQIKLYDSASLSTIAFYMHYSIALVVFLISIGLLTKFQPGNSPLLLLTVLLDPLAHLLLAVTQRWSGWPCWLRNCLRSLGGIAILKFAAWICTILGWLHATKTLLKLYEGIIPPILANLRLIPVLS